MAEKTPQINMKVQAGQGTQDVGMINKILQPGDAEFAILDEYSNVLEANGRTFFNPQTQEEEAIDVRRLVTEASAEELSKTHLTQIAVHSSNDVANAKLRRIMPGVNFGQVAGHSVGEFAVLVGEDVLSPIEGILAIDARGRIMAAGGRDNERHGKKGGVAVVTKMDPMLVEPIAVKHGVGVAVYNVPGPQGQTILSGEAIKLDDVEPDVKAEKGRYRRYESISVAVHNPEQMEESAYNFGVYLQSREALQEPVNPEAQVILNRTARPAVSGAQPLELMPSHIKEPALWMQSMMYATSEGAHQITGSKKNRIVIVEVSASTVLTGINKWLATANPNIKVITFDQAIETGLDWEAVLALEAAA